jgi:hypothetical protein
MTGHKWGFPERERPNNFIVDTVFLCHKREGGESGGGVNVGISSKEKVEAMMADSKLDITKLERGRLAGGNHVFTRAKEICKREQCCTCRQWRGYRV